jgi:serine/threonine protein kinase
MLGTDHRLVGLLFLGRRKSEEPYTAGDRKLLEVVMDEIAIIYENVSLKERIDREQKVQRQVLAQLGDKNVNLLRECPVCGVCYDSTSNFCDQDSEKLTLTLPVDRVIDQKYRLERLIGKGGMGAVYEASDLRLGRRVAVKILIGNMFGDQMALQRFQREARACAKLSHTNIVSVYDFGTLRGEGAYLVMELVQGRTLRMEMQRLGTLSPDYTADLFQQLLEGVKHAHRQGIVHRDLKPENVLIATQENGIPIVKVLDFGLAKIQRVDAGDPHTLTLPGAVLGTIHYMSPEQLFGGDDISERTDIFALGVIAIECLTGSRPFVADSSAGLVTAILRNEFQIDAKTGDATELNEVLQKCLAKDPTERFESVEQMQKELTDALRHCPPSGFVMSFN